MPVSIEKVGLFSPCISAKCKLLQATQISYRVCEAQRVCEDASGVGWFLVYNVMYAWLMVYV